MPLIPSSQKRFTDQTETLNYGYIDKNDPDFIERGATTYFNTSEDDFKRISVTRVKSASPEFGDSILTTVTPQLTDGVWTMKVMQPLKVVNSNGSPQPELETGTIIGIPNDRVDYLITDNTVTTTGKSFPTYILATRKKADNKPETPWVDLIEGEGSGFVDLGFQYGSLPEDRALVHPVSDF